MTTRERRKPIPVRIKLDVVIRQRAKCACGCGEWLGTLDQTAFDHVPALGLREWVEEKNDYNPPSNDPERIFAKLRAHHDEKTVRDIKAIAKAKRLANPKPKKPSRIRSRGFDKTRTRKMDGTASPRKERTDTCR